MASTSRCSISAGVVLGGSLGAMHDVVDAHEHRLRQQQAPVDFGAAHRTPRRISPDPLAVLGVEAVARDEHQARDKPVERIAPREQAHALALAEREDPHRDHRTARRRRSGTASRADSSSRISTSALASWLSGGKPARASTRSTFSRSSGISRASPVGGRRVQPEEAPLAGDPAVGSEALDADVVEIGGPVDGRRASWPW